jgi:hypothetical protein
LLPGGTELGALIALACDATRIDFPARIGLTQTSNDGPAAADVPGTTSSPPSAPARARSAALGTHPTLGAGERPGATAAAVAQAANDITARVAAEAGRAAALAYVDAINTAHLSQASAKEAGTPAGKHRYHHGFFSGQSRGTEVLLAIIFANLVILAGIVLWRLAARWVLPRFA